MLGFRWLHQGRGKLAAFEFEEDKRGERLRLWVRRDFLSVGGR